jgi:hypothetical protein
MVATLFPLIYNSGIQRDGTTFQSTYCTDAQWMRFQRDRLKKMGGMKGINFTVLIANITNLKIYPTNERQEIITFVGHQTGLTVINSNSDWNSLGQNVLLNIPANPNLMWETETVVNTATDKSYILFMATNNKTVINQNTPSLFYRKEIALALNNQPAEQVPMLGLNALINGNLCFAAPYLFLFGSNGFVQYSRSNDPFTFEGGDSGSFIAATDKVIFGRPIRGGPSTPSLLLWTLSSVVRVTNSGTDAVTGNIIFKPETISNGSSVLSSKCVVEYDGFFFWPGTDRFFVYNGIVDELPNKLNQNFFFDNIDMDRRQQVFGVKNGKYGEIWWFYPVKGVPGANSRAIVYNKRENFWYDTAISRDAGTFSNNFGFMATYGQPLTNPDNIGYLWRHEFNTIQEKNTPGGMVQEPINSYFVTPLFSWVAFPPKLSKGSQPSQLVNRWIDLQRIEPDFVDTDNPSRLQVSVSTKEYAQSKSVNYAPIQFDTDTEKIDMRVQGRNMSLKFSSDEKFEVGQIMLLLGIGDAR